MYKIAMYLCVTGNIGVGKTTLVKLLSQRLGWAPFYEKPMENPFLTDFYKDEKRWSFSAQIAFLTHRFQSHQELQKKHKNAILDRSLFEDGEIFARSAFELGWMSPREYKTYHEMYSTLLSFVHAPIGYIYLKCSFDNLIKRIGLRGRDFERNIDLNYLRILGEGYDLWAQKLGSRALTLETNAVDYSVEGPDREAILGEIEHFLESRITRNPEHHPVNALSL